MMSFEAFQARIAAAAAGGFDQDDVDAAYASGIAARATTEGSFQPIDGTVIADRSDATGAITYSSAGTFAATLTAGAAVADIQSGSWVTIAADDAAGDPIVGLWKGSPQILANPPAGVDVYFGYCFGADFGAATNAMLFGVRLDGAGYRSTAARINAGVIGDDAGSVRNDSPGTRGSWLTRGASGDTQVFNLRGDGLTAEGEPDPSGGQAELTPALIIDGNLTALLPLHYVIAFVPTVAVTALAVSVEVEDILTTFRGSLLANRLMGTLALGGQSNAVGSESGPSSAPLHGIYIQQGSYRVSYSPTDDFSSAVGMLTDHGGAITRRVIERGAGGTTIQQHIDTHGPALIADCVAAGGTIDWHTFIQGEADSKTQTDADAYAGKLATYLGLWRTAFPGIKFALVHVQVIGGGFDFASTVNAAITASALANADVFEVVGPYGDGELHWVSDYETAGNDVSALLVADGTWDAA